MPEQTNIHNHEPDPQFTQRFIDAVGSVQTYNERHTGAVGAMKGLFEIVIANVVDEADQPKVSHAEEAEMEKQLVQLIQANDLRKMGITLFDTSSIVKEADLSEGANKRPSSLIMLISDGDRFKDTLYKLRPTDEQRPQTEQNVATLLTSAVLFVQALYPERIPSDEAGEVSPEDAKAAVDRQLDLFMELNPALVSQGFANSGAYKTLSEYAARYISGTLAEYREAEAQGLLASEDTFGPSAWVKDENPEGLNRRWTEAFDLLKSMRDQEEPSSYFTELFGKLRADFDLAQHWLDTVPTYGDEHDQAYKKWEQEAAEFRAQLDKKDLGFEERIRLNTNLPQPPRPPQGAYPSDYVDGLKKQMEVLAQEWEKSFAPENAAYLTEKEEGNDTPQSQ